MIGMIQQDQCFKCGNSHEGSCSTEAIYFYWMPQPDEYPQEVLIVGDWTRWQRKEMMKRVNISNGDKYFSILLALSEGTHQYKFIVDGAWRHGPSSPTILNQFGELNNIIQIFPKKTYIEKHKDNPVRISSNICVEGLKLVGSWDQWSSDWEMTKTFNPLKGTFENIIDLPLEANLTYEFKFKHGSQYLIDEKYPTLGNPFGSLNNCIIVYERFITTDTPTPSMKKRPSSLTPNSAEKTARGRAFRWKKIGCSVDLPYQRVQGHSMCSVGQNLFIFGGKSRNQFYNSLLWVDSKFQRVHFQDMVPDGRAFHTMKVYGNKILVYGGNNNQILEDYNAFNVSQRSWLESPDIPKPHEIKLQKQSCVLFESLLVFFGGYHCDLERECPADALSHHLRVLDLQKMLWVDNILLQGTHPPGRFAHTASLVESIMYVFGGICDPLCMKNLNDMWRINLQNIQSLSWQQVETKGKPPAPRHGHTMNSLRKLLIIFGGQDDANSFLNDIVVFHTEECEWIHPIVHGAIPRPRTNHAAANSANEQIIMFGGRTANNTKNKCFYILESAQLAKTTSFFSEEDESDDE